MGQNTERYVKEVVEKYRDGMTPAILIEQVIELGVFNTITPGDTESLARRNYGLELMAKYGLTDDDILIEALDAWTKMKYKKEEQHG